MKTLLLCFALAQTSQLFAQQPAKAEAVADKEITAMKASVEISDGKAWLIVDGNTTLLRQEIFIGSTRVSPDGTVTTADGKKTRLHNGDKVVEDGSLQHPADKQKQPAPQEKESSHDNL